MWLIFGLLSVLAWGLVNVFNSVFVHNYVKSPLVINWIQSVVTLVLLLILSFKLDITSSWVPILLLFGITAYAGDLMFFYVMERMDVSVLNASWSILALFLSISGFFLFGESWTFEQTLGSLLIISGTLLLSFYHKHINIFHTLWPLFVLALLYVPYSIVKKYALDAGQSVSGVFFWMLIGRELLSVCMPLIFPWIIKEASTVLRMGWHFPITCLITIVTYFCAEYFGILAFKFGSISLVSVIENIQPFAVMCIAWLFILLWPKKAPKELITHQSVIIKLNSFCLVCFGVWLMSGI